MLLSGFAETTRPWRTFGLPGPCSFGAAASRGGADARAALCFSRWRRLYPLRSAALLRLRSSRSRLCCSIVCWSGIVRLPLQLARQLEHHAARLDHRDPALRRALARAHAGLGRLRRDRLVGEDVDPDLAAALDLARHRDTGGLDLAVRDPAAVRRLEPVLAEL